MRLRDLNPRHRARLTSVRQSIADFSGEPWAISSEEQLRTRIAEMVSRTEGASTADLRQAIMESDEGDHLPMDIVDGVAVIRIHGLLIPHGAAFWRWWGIRATDYEEIAACHVLARNDARVQSVLHDVDSPGGLVRGSSEAIEQAWETTNVKPVHTHSSGLIASMGYHIGSQAHRMSADRGTLIGSIGELMVIVDASKAYEEMGIEVVVIASGPHKGAGVWGAKLTDEQREALQELVNDGYAQFLGDIARARDINEEAADGRVFYAQRAMGFGLIDAVERSPEAFETVLVAKLQGDDEEEPPPKDAEDDEEDDDEEEESKQQSSVGDDATTTTKTTPHAGVKEGSMATKKNTPATPAAEQTEVQPIAGGIAVAQTEHLRAELSEKDARIAELEDELKEKNDELRLAETVLGKTRKNRVTEILDEFQAAGRFDPADRPDMEEAAEPFEDKPDKLRAYLDRILPQSKDKPKPKTSIPEADNGQAAPMDDELSKLGREFEFNARDVELGGTVTRVNFARNTGITKEGKEVALTKEG